MDAAWRGIGRAAGAYCVARQAGMRSTAGEDAIPVRSTRASCAWSFQTRCLSAQPIHGFREGFGVRAPLTNPPSVFARELKKTPDLHWHANNPPN